ncbi:UNVERIFIED_ORG: hypothetical protein ABIB52_001027 [Arthrobacter sp. UYCu721]
MSTQFRISSGSSPCVRVYAGLHPPALKVLPQQRVLFGQTGYAVNSADGQLEVVDPVEHGHVERRCGGSLLLVAAHVQAFLVGATVGQPVDQRGIAVVGEDDWFVGGDLVRGTFGESRGPWP